METSWPPKEMHSFVRVHARGTCQGGEGQIKKAPEADILKRLESEWQQRMAAPLDALVDFEASLDQAIVRAEDVWLGMSHGASSN